MARAYGVIMALLNGALGGLLGMLAVALLLSVLFPAEAHAYGAAQGEPTTVNCTRTSQAGYPGSSACAANIGELRMADIAHEATKREQALPDRDYSFHSFRTPCDAAAVSGTCAYKLAYVYPACTTNCTTGYEDRSFTYAQVQTVQQRCPTGDARYKQVGASCYCAPGYSPQPDGTCGTNSCPKAGTVVAGSAGQSYLSSDTSSSSHMGCHDGCLVSGAFGATTSTPPIQHMVAGPLVHVGQVCNPSSQGGSYPGMGSPASDPGTVATSCPAPKCPGTVNGTSVCVACSSTSTGQVTKPNDSQTSGGTISKTQCVGGVCTTTETTVDAEGREVSGGQTTVGTGGGNPLANGTGTGTGSGDGEGAGETMSEFCEANPNSMMCSEDGESNFTGSCSSNFSCDGDVIQCAIAREQHERNCVMFEDATDLSDKGNAAVGAGDHPEGHPYADAEETSINFADSIDQTDLLAGSCPVGHSVTVQGKSFSLITSEMCDMLGMLGNLIVAVGALFSAFIVFRG